MNLNFLDSFPHLFVEIALSKNVQDEGQLFGFVEVYGVSLRL